MGGWRGGGGGKNHALWTLVSGARLDQSRQAPFAVASTGGSRAQAGGDDPAPNQGLDRVHPPVKETRHDRNPGKPSGDGPTAPAQQVEARRLQQVDGAATTSWRPRPTTRPVR